MALCLVTGAGGQLGSVLLRRLCRRGQPAVGITSPTGPRPDGGLPTRALDLLDRDATARCLRELAPRCVVHTAAVSRVGEALADPTRARRVNVGIPELLAELCDGLGARLVQVSTDMVFDGASAPYAEGDVAEPGTVYGRTKLAGEQAALRCHDAAVVRLPLLYGIPAVARPSFFGGQIEALRAGEPLTLFGDEWRTPLWLEDAAHALDRVAHVDEAGVFHAGGPERLSRVQMAERLATALGVRDPHFRIQSRLDVGAAEPRPEDLSLESTRFEACFGVAPGRPMAAALAAADLDGH